MIVIFTHLIQSASTLPTDSAALQRAISALERDITKLGNSSIPWEKYWLPTFTGVVALGIMMELWVILREYRDEMGDWRRGTIRSPERPSATKYRVEIASVLFVTIGIFGEAGVGLWIAHINGQLRAKSAELQTDSDQLVALLNQETGQLRNDAESERLARVKIEAAVAFRSLNDQQKRDIGAALARFGSVTGASMWFANGSAEAELFADDIAEALRFAHIHTTTVGGVMEMPEGGANWDASIKLANTGVDISSTSNPLARELAGALLKELTGRGFDANRQPDQKSKNNPPVPIIWVTVQARPNGPQGEYKLQAEREAKHKNNTKKNP
jgi:hypothetical protein